jgi:CRISP-associated protein Cas1
MQTLENFNVEVKSNTSTIRVSALHALAYCPRLFYLEEVEELYTQDAAVFAGRRLHAELEKQEGEEWAELFLTSEELGIRGRLDALRTRDGETIPYEHKRGKCHRDENKQPQAWESDKLQILAYACLLESACGITVKEGRIRYHADNILIHVPLDDAGREAVKEAINKAKILRQSPYRPPVAENERLCTRCSLAPVCLPEEARLAHDREWQPIRLFPEDDERQIIHVLEPGTCVGRTGEQIKITRRNQPVETIPARQIGQLVLHSFSQISTQALHFCADQSIGVHFISGGDRYVGSFDNRQGSIQRRIHQFTALTNSDTCLELARRLVICRAQGQRKFLMRGKAKVGGVGFRPVELCKMGKTQAGEKLTKVINQMKAVLKLIAKAKSLDSLLGYEGNLAALYFDALPDLISLDIPQEMHFENRNRRPPKDRFNSILSFGYSLLIKDMMNAILTVGLEPALGFYHQPRSQAAPLALDLMEIFRVPLVDMTVMASVNRNQWDIKDDFDIRGQQVWLSEVGKRKFVELYENRKQETWKHPATGYSLTYRRLFELEVRLLEKEWMGEGGLFGQLILR